MEFIFLVIAAVNATTTITRGIAKLETFLIIEYLYIFPFEKAYLELVFDIICRIVDLFWKPAIAMGILVL
jgi:hypothetical protein